MGDSKKSSFINMMKKIDWQKVKEERANYEQIREDNAAAAGRLRDVLVWMEFSPEKIGRESLLREMECLRVVLMENLWPGIRVEEDLTPVYGEMETAARSWAEAVQSDCENSARWAMAVLYAGMKTVSGEVPRETFLESAKIYRLLRNLEKDVQSIRNDMESISASLEGSAKRYEQYRDEITSLDPGVLKGLPMPMHVAAMLAEVRYLKMEILSMRADLTEREQKLNALLKDREYLSRELCRRSEYDPTALVPGQDGKEVER